MEKALLRSPEYALEGIDPYRFHSSMTRLRIHSHTRILQCLPTYPRRRDIPPNSDANAKLFQVGQFHSSFRLNVTIQDHHRKKFA